jgi:hypothetical protein
VYFHRRAPPNHGSKLLCQGFDLITCLPPHAEWDQSARIQESNLPFTGPRPSHPELLAPRHCR